MTNLPDKSYLTSGLTTEANFQSAIGSLYDYLSELVTGSTPTITDIVLGSITPTSSFITVDTENDTTTDDLTNMLTTNIGTKVVFMRSQSSARSVVLKHLAGGTGQFYLNTQVDVTLNNSSKMIAFVYNATSNRWEELWRNWGVFTPTAGDITNVKASLNMGTAANADVGSGSSQVPLNSQLGALAYLGQIASNTQIANGVIQGNHVANSTLPIGKLSNHTANSLLGFNASGVPSLITSANNANHVLRGDMTFGVPPQAGGCVLLGDVDLTSTTTISWTARTDIKSIRVEVLHPAPAQEIYIRLLVNGSVYSGNAYYMSTVAVTGTRYMAEQPGVPGSGTNVLGGSFAPMGVSTRWGVTPQANSFWPGFLFEVIGLNNPYYKYMFGSSVFDPTSYGTMDFKGVLAVSDIVNGITIVPGYTTITFGRLRVWGYT